MNGNLVVNDYKEFVVREDGKNSKELFRSFDRSEVVQRAKDLGKSRIFVEHFKRRMADIWHQQPAHKTRITEAWI